MAPVLTKVRLPSTTGNTGPQVANAEVNDGTDNTERQIVAVGSPEFLNALAAVPNTALVGSEYAIAARTIESRIDEAFIAGSLTAVDNGPNPSLSANTAIFGTPVSGSYASLALRGGEQSVAFDIGSTAGFVYFEKSMDSTNGVDGRWFALACSNTSNNTVDSVAQFSGLYNSVGVLNGAYVRARMQGTYAVPCPITIRASRGSGYGVRLLPSNYGLGSVSVTANGALSLLNGTTTPLGANGVYTGTFEAVFDYASISVYVFSDQPSATDGLVIQQSSNSFSADILDPYTIVAGVGKAYNVPPQGAYFRIVYTNGATAQGVFRLQVIFHKSAKRGSSVRPQDARDNQNDMEENLAYPMLYDGTSGNWNRQRGTIAYGMSMDPSRNAPDVLVAATTISAINSVPLGAASANSAAQIATGAGANTVAVNVVTAATAGVLTGQISNNGGANWYTITAALFLNVATGAYSATLPTNTTGIYQIKVAAASLFRVTALTAPTGSWSVLLEASTAAASLAVENTVPVSVAATLSVIPKPATTGGNSIKAIESAAAVFLDFAKASAGQIYGMQFSNSGAGWAFVKLYNKASAPVVASDTPIFKIGIPPGGSREISRPSGIAFATGIAIAITGAYATTDATALAAGQVLGSIEYT